MDFATAIETHTSSPARRLATIRGIPWLPIVQALAATMMCLLAPESNAAVLQGTVVNKSTNRFLERATVQVVGTRLRALTDKEGNFRIAGVPAGTFTVTADYTGLDLAVTSHHGCRGADRARGLRAAPPRPSTSRTRSP